MESTSNRGSGQEQRAWRSWRKWAILAGALILFLVAFDVLERLAGPSAVATVPATAPESIRPEVTKLGRAGVRVEVKGGYQLTQNYHDEVLADRLVVCLEEGITTSPAYTEGEAGRPPESGLAFARRARAKQVWYELIRIHNACTSELDAASPDGRPRAM